MQLTASKRELLRLADRMIGVAESKSTMPILANVLLAAKEGRVTLSATDLYIAASAATEAEIKSSGAAYVNAKDFHKRLKELPDGPVTLTDGDRGCTLKASTARKYTMRSGDASEFPTMPTPGEDAIRFGVAARTLSTLIAKTHFCISTDETRSHLNSLRVEVEPGTIRAIATDGHRMALAEQPIECGVTLEMLLPLKGVRELRHLADAASAQDNATIDVIKSGSTVFFEHGGLTFSIKEAQGTFPPYRQVLPELDEKNLVRVPRAAMHGAIRAVSVAASDRTDGVKLALGKGLIKLSSESPESGDGTDEVSVEWTGANKSIGFSAKYLVDAFGAFTTDDATMQVAGELDPVVIRPVGEESGSALWLIMPMRI